MEPAQLPEGHIVIPAEELPSYEAALAAGLEQTTDVAPDGRVNIDLNSRLARTLTRFVPELDRPPPSFVSTGGPVHGEQAGEYDVDALTLVDDQEPFTLRLNIVIQVVGSRGDVQPFIALGQELQRHGHRVRLATHAAFAQFVKSSGLEFYPIGGDPAALMAYMVKNPGLLPGMRSLRDGEIGKNRKMIVEILHGCWNSCLDPDPATGMPFIANAIIANPPSFGHISCAEALGIPLHMMFTMPWTRTRMFSHPLANLRNLKDMATANYISFTVVEWMTWQGLGDVINEWRKSLGLEHIPYMEGPHLAEKLQIPFTYCWSPGLVPRPIDWPEHIDVCGFFFRDTPEYEPPEDLKAFLRAGPAPIYIGFGSIVIDDPDTMTRSILDAIKETNVRAIISRGWSNLGNGYESDGNVFFLGDCPHEWLFQHVSAVFHHGGAGTTACGLRNALPTTVIPFFGDQPFWGEMVAASGAGPTPIPGKKLNSQNFAEAIEFCLGSAAEEAARAIAQKMSSENGVQAAVRSFYRHLPVETMRCEVLPDQPAAWIYKKRGRKVRLSSLAAHILTDSLRVRSEKLVSFETKPFMIQNNRSDPITGSISASIATGVNATKSTANIIVRPIKASVTNPAKNDMLQKFPTASDENMKVFIPNPGDPNDGASRLGGSQILAPADQDEKPARKPRGRATAAAIGFGSGLGDALGGTMKGIGIDIPLALTEGMRAVPGLYGEPVRDIGYVKDWKSGLVVSGKNFGYGVGEGLWDLFAQPVEGSMKEGVWGGVKGTGKGVLQLFTKMSSATTGLVAYPALGIYKSVRRAVHKDVRDRIVKVKLDEGKYMSEANEQQSLKMQVVEVFGMYT